MKKKRNWKNRRKENTGDRRGGCRRRIEEKNGVGIKEGRLSGGEERGKRLGQNKKDGERKHLRLCCKVKSNELCR